MGLVPIGSDLMYMYVTTPEPGNPRYPREGLAARHARQAEACAASASRQLADQHHRRHGRGVPAARVAAARRTLAQGRVVLLGDAVHATTPHLGQGAGMAIEDSIVLAEELARQTTPEDAFTAYQARRFERCRYIVEQSWPSAAASSASARRSTKAAVRGMFEMIARPL